jgi:hypothetical protein
VGVGEGFWWEARCRGRVDAGAVLARVNPRREGGGGEGGGIHSTRTRILLLASFTSISVVSILEDGTARGVRELWGIRVVIKMECSPISQQ